MSVWSCELELFWGGRRLEGLNLLNLFGTEDTFLEEVRSYGKRAYLFVALRYSLMPLRTISALSVVSCCESRSLSAESVFHGKMGSLRGECVPVVTVSLNFI